MAVFDREDTYKKVVEVVAQKLSIDKEKIAEVSTFQDLGADSLDMLEIIITLQDKFGIEIDDETADKLDGLHAVVNYIHEKRTK